MVVRFKTQETGIECGDIMATLMGETFDGRNITGIDSIKTVGNGGCPKIPIADCDIQLDRDAYLDGDTVTANTMRFANLTDTSITTEINIWLDIPGIQPITLVNVGADGSVEFPAGTDVDLGPVPLFPVTAELPRGNYELTCQLLDPATGDLLAKDQNFFEIRDTYAIGEIGPAGGTIFYVTYDGRRGLEAAPVDLGNAAWGCPGTELPGADSRNIGAGAQNTADILAGCAEPDNAAAIADAYNLNGFTDWFLPSQKELQEICLTAGLDPDSAYWSSSEPTPDTAYVKDIGPWCERNTILQKHQQLVVRPIRAF